MKVLLIPVETNRFCSRCSTIFIYLKLTTCTFKTVQFLQLTKISLLFSFNLLNWKCTYDLLGNILENAFSYKWTLETLIRIGRANFFLDICVIQGTVHNYYVGRIGTVFIIGANLLLKIHPFKKFESIPDLIFTYICLILVQLRKSTIKWFYQAVTFSGLKLLDKRDSLVFRLTDISSVD